MGLTVVFEVPGAILYHSFSRRPPWRRVSTCTALTCRSVKGYLVEGCSAYEVDPADRRKGQGSARRLTRRPLRSLAALVGPGSGIGDKTSEAVKP